MTKNPLPQIVAAAGLLAAAVLPIATLAEYKCDQPVSAIDRRACEHAAEGTDALRHFVTRTRTIYGLYIYDYLRDKEPAVVAASTTEAAKPSLSDRSETHPTATAKRVY